MDEAAWRIGDAERDAAVTELREHHVAGRLDREEFDARMGTALTARTRADLTPLFADLPHSGRLTPDPASVRPAAAPALPASRPTSPVPARYAQGIVAALWPLTILACLLTGNWMLIGLPIIVAMVLGGPARAFRGGCGTRAALRSSH